MVVYKIHSCECSFFTLEDTNQWKVLKSALKNKHIDWKKLDFIKINESKDCTFTSFGGLIYYGVKDINALKILRTVCKEELTEINYFENKLTFHILSNVITLDALDLINSEYEALDENRILFIDKYELKSKLMEGRFLLKLKGYNGLFCTNLFKDLYENEEWSGFTFEKVWESQS